MSQTEEVRVTDPTTGGQKGQKPERFSMLPPRALGAVARVYGFGADKYERDNWRRGYAWSLSMDALQRHLAAFWDGEDLDPESGEPHLAHAAFHVLTLLTFMEEFPEGDDRYRVPVPATVEGRSPGRPTALDVILGRTGGYPAEVVDVEGDTWTHNGDGFYTCTEFGEDRLTYQDLAQPYPYGFGPLEVAP